MDKIAAFGQQLLSARLVAKLILGHGRDGPGTDRLHRRFLRLLEAATSVEGQFHPVVIDRFATIGGNKFGKLLSIDAV